MKHQWHFSLFPLAAILFLGCVASKQTAHPSSAAAAGATSTPPKRTLRVALFPYLPDANHDQLHALASTIEQEFEAQHRDIDLVLKPFDPTTDDFYNKESIVTWLTQDSGEHYDVVEIDTVLLGTLSSAIEPWTDVAPSDDWHPAARSAVVARNQVMAFPHLMCGHFCFTRDRDTARARSERALVKRVRALGTEQKLVGDFAGSWNLPSLYLDAWADTNGPQKIATAMGRLDGKVVGSLRAVEHLCKRAGGDPCIDGTFHDNPDLAVDAFAKGEAGTFIGYSEYLNEILSKRTDTAPIYISSVPLGAGSHPVLFTDALVLRKGCRDACQSDALALAKFLDGAQMYELLLMSRDAGSARPRYLLPATKSAFQIPSVLTDPYYPGLQKLVADGASFPTSGLNEARGEMKKQLMAALSKK